jgi:peroxiredoxin
VIPKAQPLLSLGDLAPDFRLLDHQGHSVGPSTDMGQGGLALLFFSSSWLPGDLALLKAYAQAYPRLQSAGLGVLAISGVNWETLHHLAKRVNSPFPLVFDPCCRFSKYYQTMAIPKFVTGRAVYGLNPQGRIVLARKQATPDEVLTALSHSTGESTF